MYYEHFFTSYLVLNNEFDIQQPICNQTHGTRERDQQLKKKMKITPLTYVKTDRLRKVSKAQILFLGVIADTYSIVLQCF